MTQEVTRCASGLTSRGARPLLASQPASTAAAAALTDVVVLDVHDELGQGVEVQPAAPESAGVGEERGGGDSAHGRCRIGRVEK